MRRGNQRGFSYLIMLFALAIFGLGLASIGESWSRTVHRDKEEEMLRILGAYVAAINNYYLGSPGTPKAFPLTLDDLLQDRRHVGTVRYLRRVYRDPMTGQQQWGLIKNSGGRIIGVYSLSDRQTLRKQPVSVPGAQPVVGSRYSDWRFVSALAE
jgi:type II secretory pathway pseudopilin PulG